VFSFSLSLFVVVVIIIIIISSRETSEPLGQENIIISQVSLSPPQKKKHGRKPKRWTVGLNTSYKSISAG
jgi:hypothetical protein